MSDNIKANNGRNLVLKLIYDIHGIRFNDLSRITKVNNGTLSHSIRVLERNNLIKYSNPPAQRPPDTFRLLSVQMIF